MARLLYTSDAVVGPPRSTLSILTAPPGTYSYKALADLQDVDGRPVSGGRLTTDQGGSLPDFFGPEGDVATLYALLPDGSTVTLSLAAENASPLTAADARGAYRTLTGPDSFTIDSTDASGNVTQVTEHFGSTTVVTVYTWNTDGSIATERATVNGVQGALKTYAYTTGVLTGAA